MTAGGATATRACLAVIGLRGLPDVIGGIETHCELLYPMLAVLEPNLDIALLVRRRYAATTHATLAPGVTITALPSLPGSGLETVSHTLFALLHARWRLRSRMVHLHGIGPAFFTPLARLMGMRTVVTHHATDFERAKWTPWGRFFLKTGEAMAARFADRVICVSEALRRDFLDRYPAAAARTVTIRHGARIDDVGQQACERVVGSLGLVLGHYVLAVGRLEETKRFDDLIAAHAAAGPGVPPLVIVGASIDDTACEEALRAMAADGPKTGGPKTGDTETPPRVVFAGFRTGAELAALYRGAAYFVHASEMEGFGLVVLEAMIAGLPMRLSDIPPHREFDLPDHVYFPVGDRAALTAILRAGAADPEETADYRVIIERHKPILSARAHAALFRTLPGVARLAEAVLPVRE